MSPNPARRPAVMHAGRALRIRAHVIRRSAVLPGRRAAALLLALVVCGCQQPRAPRSAAPERQPSCRPGYSYACWLNGWRKQTGQTGPEVLAIQTSGYQFTLNLSDFSKAAFSPRSAPPVGYAGALKEPTDLLYRLPPADLGITVEVDGERYRAVSCAAGTEPDPKRLGLARMWESGRFVQHFELVALRFENRSGKPLGCKADLSLVAWPDSLTLSVALAPDAASGSPAWRDARVALQLTGGGLDCRAEQACPGLWAPATTNVLTLTHNLPGRLTSGQGIAIQVASGTNNVFPVAYEPAKNCFVAKAAAIRRAFRTGYTDIRDYDDFLVTVDNAGPRAADVPFLLDFRAPANITGLCPLLCDREGRPTGLPVQLSKNWHYAPMGAYLMAYASLPAPPGRSEYLLRVAYGFYGALPSASHAQLSLVGYAKSGGNGRWDQMAIGCWGETFCLDMDMSLVDIVATDVRMLMARNGLNGTKWGWTDAGWGGDWLSINGAAGGKCYFRDLRTAYLSQGPCLTDVRYDGYYGAQREVGLRARVQTLRTDDYARTFHTLAYTFNRALDAQGAYFFMQGRTGQYATPVVAFGNRRGLLAERRVTGALKPAERFIDRLTLEGEGPWWVAFPGAGTTSGRDWGNGYRALVIRSYRATFGGRRYACPTLSFPLNSLEKGRHNLNLELVAPRGVERFAPGDQVEFVAEWITLPRVADDYYGPNESFRKHLSQHPCSWETTFREAAGNDLDVQVSGGTLESRYPIEVECRQRDVEVRIAGGVGFVPVRFRGLASAQGYELREIRDGREQELGQAVHGNDFWQCEFDEATATYQLTYNLPLDGKAVSTWRLKKN